MVVVFGSRGDVPRLLIEKLSVLNTATESVGKLAVQTNFVLYFNSNSGGHYLNDFILSVELGFC